MTQPFKKLLCSGSLLAIAACMAMPSVAVAEQAANKSDKPSKPGVDEIVVTAQKRAENLQDVPVSVSVITSADLDDKQIINLEDIRSLVPNLYLEQALSGTTTPKMFIRGVGVDNQVYSFDSPIGLYFDGVYISRVTGALVDLFDTQQVEFLRGPQGTLFGRNSSAGALRITTKLPNLDHMEGQAVLAYGTANQINGNYAVSAPLIKGKLGLRATFISRHNDGFQVDQTGERFMNNNINAFRASLLYKPAENVDVIVRGDYMADHSKPTQAVNFRDNPDNNLFTFDRTLEAPNRNIVEPWGISGTVKVERPDYTFTSITAYRGLKYRNAGDVDGKITVRSFEVDRQDLDEWQFSQEAYFTGDHLGKTRLQWTVGAFYLHEKNDFYWALRIFSDPPTEHFLQDTDSFATYGQVSYPVTDRLNLTGGLRYTYEKKALTATQTLADGTPNTAFLFDDSITANEVNWKLAADYAATDHVTLYANAGTGFRSGGFNGSARDVPSILGGSFGPETSFSMEGGAKTQSFQNRVRLNLDYFYVKYDGLQQAVTLSDGSIATRNVSAKVHGVEAELTAVPVDGLQLTATVGTMNNEIENSVLLLKDTPKLQFRIGAIYTMPLPENRGQLRIGANVSHVSSYFNGTENAAAGLVEPYEMLNAQIAYTTPDDRWEFKLSGTNLGDHIFATHTFDIAGGFISSVDFPNTPRLILFSVGYRF